MKNTEKIKLFRHNFQEKNIRMKKKLIRCSLRDDGCKRHRTGVCDKVMQALLISQEPYLDALIVFLNDNYILSCMTATY